MSSTSDSPLLRPLIDYESRALAAAEAIDRRRDDVAAHVRTVPAGRFARLINRVRLAAECIADVSRGRYRRVPWGTVGSLALALGYFLAPADAIPDFIPLTGFVDDAAVIGLVFASAERELKRYCTWRGLDATQYFGSNPEE
jgi:uncharacterized membrane protein YkvA (DUF1232 family)